MRNIGATEVAIFVLIVVLVAGLGLGGLLLFGGWMGGFGMAPSSWSGTGMGPGMHGIGGSGWFWLLLCPLAVLMLLAIAGIVWALARQSGHPAGLSCPNCGRAVEPSWRLCPHCGATLRPEETV